MTKYQNLPIPVARVQIRKLLRNYLQEGPEGSFREVAEGTYIGSLVVSNLATIEVDSSTTDVDSTSLQIELEASRKLPSGVS